MGSMIELQQSVIKRLGRMGESTKAYQFHDIDENMSRIWTDIYEKEFRQFFHMFGKGPTLAPDRDIPFRCNRFANKGNGKCSGRCRRQKGQPEHPVHHD